MTQRSQPIEDIITGNWSPTPVFAQTNDPYPGDSTFVTSFGSPTGDTFEVKLAEMGAPVTGAHRLTIRLRGQGAGQIAWVSLLQGYPVATPLIIKTMVFATTDALWNDYVLDLSETEIELITDYADIRVRVTVVASDSSSASSSTSASGSTSQSASGSGSGGIPCCPDKVIASTLFGVYTNQTGGCTCLTTTDAFLKTDPLRWVGTTGDGCSSESQALLTCDGPTGQFNYEAADVISAVLVSTTCGPVFSIVFDLTFSALICIGTARLTISE